MSCLPEHGRIKCTECFMSPDVEFDITKRTVGEWRITCNPLAFGNPEAEIVVLGFSKGQTQSGALDGPHNEIAFKSSRLKFGKILAHVGLFERTSDQQLKRDVHLAISNKKGRFHFGSLIRCTVERFEKKSAKWKTTTSGMLDKFVTADLGKEVSQQCSTKFLGALPPQTKLVIMFGMGTKQNYVSEAKKIFEKAISGKWYMLNDISYSDGKITVVHVEHFASQGAHIDNWLGVNEHKRSLFGDMAKKAVEQALA